MFERSTTYSTFDELETALRAADTLFLGFRVHNYWQHDDTAGPDLHGMFYVLELFEDAPERNRA